MNLSVLLMNYYCSMLPKEQLVSVHGLVLPKIAHMRDIALHLTKGASMKSQALNVFVPDVNSSSIMDFTSYGVVSYVLSKPLVPLASVPEGVRSSYVLLAKKLDQLVEYEYKLMSSLVDNLIHSGGTSVSVNLTEEGLEVPIVQPSNLDDFNTYLATQLLFLMYGKGYRSLTLTMQGYEWLHVYDNQTEKLLGRIDRGGSMRVITDNGGVTLNQKSGLLFNHLPIRETKTVRG